ncbi:hypothetical protein VTI74DRAFT_4724 [Chaetomium olivicolor]
MVHAESPEFVPKPLAWGKYETSSTYFILTQFRDVGQQPPEPIKFAERLAELHKNSVSPTGKFGFHTTTYHAKLPQVTDWTASWTELFRKQISHMIKLDEAKHGSFYAHNEYKVGNWRAIRHRLSRKEYVESYKKAFPPSEPQEEWDDRNLLYSLRFDLTCAILIPGPNPQRRM